MKMQPIGCSARDGLSAESVVRAGDSVSQKLAHFYADDRRRHLPVLTHVCNEPATVRARLGEEGTIHDAGEISSEPRRQVVHDGLGLCSIAGEL